MLRDAFFKSGFINNLKIEWFVENDSNKHSFKLPYHVSDNPDRWLDRDPEILNVVAEKGCPYILMHSRGNSKTMDQLAVYNNLIDELESIV